MPSHFSVTFQANFDLCGLAVMAVLDELFDGDGQREDDLAGADTMHGALIDRSNDPALRRGHVLLRTKRSRHTVADSAKFLSFVACRFQ